MFLKQIRFIHFKSFTDLTLSFVCDDGTLRNRTILLGENGLGKSSLLKGIALVMAGSNALGHLIGDPNKLIAFGSDQCTIQAILDTGTGDKTIELVIKQGQDFREIILENQASLTIIDEALKQSKRNYFTVGYGANRRLNIGDRQIASGTGYYSGLPRRVQNIATLFNDDAPLQSLTAWAIELDYRTNGAELDIIKSALNEYLPGITFDKIDKEAGVLLFTTPESTKPVPLQYLTEGYQNVASWLGDLLYRITSTFEEYKNPMQTKGLLMVDEIDVHLHVKWQRIMLDYVENKLPNFQFIATSYSPLTAQQAGDGELFVLTRENGEVVVKPFIGSPRLMQISQLLMSPMFGLETDESLSVENLKNEYLELSAQEKTKSAHFKKIKEAVEQLPVQPLKSDVFLKEKEDLIARLSSKATK